MSENITSIIVFMKKYGMVKAFCKSHPVRSIETIVTLTHNNTDLKTIPRAVGYFKEREK
jgi:hypothetical protein